MPELFAKGAAAPEPWEGVHFGRLMEGVHFEHSVRFMMLHVFVVQH